MTDFGVCNKIKTIQVWKTKQLTFPGHIFKTLCKMNKNTINTINYQTSKKITKKLKVPFSHYEMLCCERILGGISKVSKVSKQMFLKETDLVT